MSLSIAILLAWFYNSISVLPPCRGDHIISHGFKGSATSTILCKKVIQFLKNRKPVVRIYIVRALHNPCTGIVWRPRDDRAANLRFSVEMLPKKLYVASARKLHGVRTFFVESFRRLRDDCTEIARFPCGSHHSPNQSLESSYKNHTITVYNCKHICSSPYYYIYVAWKIIDEVIARCPWQRKNRHYFQRVIELF